LFDNSLFEASKESNLHLYDKGIIAVPNERITTLRE